MALGLKTYVDDAGDVDYRRLAVEKTKAFTSFLDAVSGLCPRRSHDNRAMRKSPSCLISTMRGSLIL